MQHTLTLITFLLVIIIFSSCKKDNNSNAKTNCFADASTVRQIINAPAIIQEVGGQFYIVEQGTYDTKLNPCMLPTEFQVNHLPVTVSGDVKSTIRGINEPCCTDDFVITNISR